MESKTYGNFLFPPQIYVDYVRICCISIGVRLLKALISSTIWRAYPESGPAGGMISAIMWIQIYSQLSSCLKHAATTAIKKFIFASTSSVYGDTTGRVPEDTSTAPLSPYGVSKLTGEHLCRVYWKNDGVPIVILRFFTVYGPRQRSDMAFHRFIKQMIANEPITLIGDGTQSRDFTYISDCIEATAAVANQPSLIGETINIGGKERSSIMNVIRDTGEFDGKKADIVNASAPCGESLCIHGQIFRKRPVS